MKDYIEQYLLDKVDRLIFISLKEEILENPSLEKIKNIEIPIFSSFIPNLGNDREEGFTSLSIANSMMYILGIDRKFKYNAQYVDFIKAFTDSPVNFSKDLIMTAYRNNNLIDSIIFTRAYIHGFSEEDDFLFNYGALCEEYAAQIKDEEQSKAFQNQAKEMLYPFTEGKIERALEYIEGEEYDKAEKLLEEVLKKSPDNIEANFYTGYLKRIQGRVEEALDSYEKAYNQDNTLPRLINEMGLCFSMLGDFEQALELFLYAHSLNENSGDILCNISMVYLNMNDMENARKYASMAYDLNPDDEIAQACFKEIRKYE